MAIIRATAADLDDVLELLSASAICFTGKRKEIRNILETKDLNHFPKKSGYEEEFKGKGTHFDARFD